MSSSEKIDNKMQLKPNLNIAEFLGILKKMLLGPILSEKSMEERIKDFTVDLGELLLFLWFILLNIKTNVLEFLRTC
jgi:hypothetical protein